MINHSRVGYEIQRDFSKHYLEKERRPALQIPERF